ENDRGDQAELVGQGGEGERAERGRQRRGLAGAFAQQQREQGDEGQRHGEVELPLGWNGGAEQQPGGGGQLPARPQGEAGAEEVPVAQVGVRGSVRGLRRGRFAACAAPSGGWRRCLAA